MAAPAWAENVGILIGPFGLTKPWTNQVSVVAVGCSQRSAATTNLIMYSDVTSCGPMAEQWRVLRVQVDSVPSGRWLLLPVRRTFPECLDALWLIVSAPLCFLSPPHAALSQTAEMPPSMRSSVPVVNFDSSEA